MSTPLAESPVAPVIEVITPLDADNIETARVEPAEDVSHVENPIEPTQPEPKPEDKPIEPLAVKSAEP